MWTRAELKERAKAVLRVSYWKAFLVSLVIAFAGGHDGGFSGSSKWQVNRSQWNAATGGPGYNEYLPFIALGVLVLVLVVMFIAFAFRIFLGYPLEVGGRCYFKQAAQEDINMNYLTFSFSKGRYWNIVKTMLVKGIYIFLWTLLLIIPGIIKSYAYRMVPYILADNPNIEYNRAIELSNQMTNGQKFDMFVLDLSFIGWYLLGFLAFFVGVFFVMPYENATKAELYLTLKENAMTQGFCSRSELVMGPVVEDDYTEY